MVQFKDIFWGRIIPAYTRVVTCQECFRTTDLEKVGKTPHHHTFFEMLGNFSFGDYFKEGAIKLAWRFLTEELSLPKERLWVSVYEEDEEAHAIWRDVIGIPEEKIVRLGKDQNWWGPIGISGPCGPDTEIYWDWGDPPCGLNCKPSCECGRFSEIWNLVFMQYEAQPDGTLKELSRKGVDTGIGLERLAAVLQNVRSNFEIDLFQPICEKIEELASSPITDYVSRNIVADHIRAIAALIADGVMPDSKTSRGSVLRKIFIRTFRAAEKLGITPDKLIHLVDPVIETIGSAYTEIAASRYLIELVIKREAGVYRRRFETLSRLLKQLPEGIEAISGDTMFFWYDTHGIPLDLIVSVAQERGLKLDWNGFSERLEEQRARSRKQESNSKRKSQSYE